MSEPTILWHSPDGRLQLVQVLANVPGARYALRKNIWLEGEYWVWEGAVLPDVAEALVREQLSRDAAAATSIGVVAS